METITISPQHHKQNPSPANSSSSHGSSSKHTTQTPPVTPRPVSSNPYPTTFIQADTTSFKQVVQMLTGSPKSIIPPVKTSQKKKQGFKLPERRNSFQNGLIINPKFGQSQQVNEMLSPSILDFPALVLSPLTEERVISEKGFYLHPSPRGTPEPQLLHLFPLKSPGKGCY